MEKLSNYLKMADKTAIKFFGTYYAYHERTQKKEEGVCVGIYQHRKSARVVLLNEKGGLQMVWGYHLNLTNNLDGMQDNYAFLVSQLGNVQEWNADTQRMETITEKDADGNVSAVKEWTHYLIDIDCEKMEIIEDKPDEQKSIVEQLFERSQAQVARETKEKVEQIQVIDD